MAKKAVASLQTGSKKLVKAIRVVKKNENKGYCFEEKILPQDLVNDWLAGKPIEIKQTQPVKEEPKAEEPKAEEPKAEEPKAEEPKAEEPKAEEPKAEESKSKDSK
jgi:hypothetical protein